MLAAARSLFLLLVVLQVFAKARIGVGELGIIPADLLFLFVAGLFGIAVLTEKARLRFPPLLGAAFLYVAALGLSVAASPDLGQSLVKLASQVYLLGLALLAFHLFSDGEWLRRGLLTFAFTGAALGLAGVLTLVLFFVDAPTAWIDGPLHDLGTLPLGDYPRLELSFTHPAMLVSFLALSLICLLLADQLGWIGRRWMLAGAVVTSITALFALSPGLSGFLLLPALWLGLQRRKARSGAILIALGIVALLAGTLLALPNPVPTEGAGLFSPSVRLLAWQAALDVVAARPMLGTGLGVGPIALPFTMPDGTPVLVTDAHNTFLNIAAQCGLVGLAGLLLLVAAIVRVGKPLAVEALEAPMLRSALALALLCGLLAQGLVGSFEDARHLWITLGLLAAASSLSDQALARGATRSSQRPSGPAPQASA